MKSENSRFGFNYRSETDITFEGDYSNQLPPQLNGLSGASVPGPGYLGLTLSYMSRGQKRFMDYHVLA